MKEKEETTWASAGQIAQQADTLSTEVPLRHLIPS